MALPMHCPVCTHSQRAVIDVALTAGEAPRDLGGQYGLPTAAIARHKRVCLGLGLGRPPTRSTRPRGKRSA